MLKINFLSQQYDVGSTKTPQNYADFYNPWFMEQIKSKNLTNFGIVISDFVDKNLSAAIYKSNI